MKHGIPKLSEMDNALPKVDTNSDKPAQLLAHAYTQEKDIHLTSGQARHLSQEASTVAPQSQATTQMKGGDDDRKEEADLIGQGFASVPFQTSGPMDRTLQTPFSKVVQRMLDVRGEEIGGENGNFNKARAQVENFNLQLASILRRNLPYQRNDFTLLKNCLQKAKSRLEKSQIRMGQNAHRVGPLLVAVNEKLDILIRLRESLSPPKKGQVAPVPDPALFAALIKEKRVLLDNSIAWAEPGPPQGGDPRVEGRVPAPESAPPLRGVPIPAEPEFDRDVPPTAPLPGTVPATPQGQVSGTVLPPGSETTPAVVPPPAVGGELLPGTVPQAPDSGPGSALDQARAVPAIPQGEVSRVLTPDSGATRGEPTVAVEERQPPIAMPLSPNSDLTGAEEAAPVPHMPEAQVAGVPHLDLHEQICRLVDDDDWNNPELVKNIGTRPWDEIKAAWDAIPEGGNKKKLTLVRLRGRPYVVEEGPDPVVNYEGWSDNFMGVQEGYKWGTETEGGGISVKLKKAYRGSPRDEANYKAQYDWLLAELNYFKRTALVETDDYRLAIDNIKDKVKVLLAGNEVSLPIEIASTARPGKIDTAIGNRAKLRAKMTEKWPGLELDKGTLTLKAGRDSMANEIAMAKFNKYFSTHSFDHPQRTQNPQHVTTSGKKEDRLGMARELLGATNGFEAGSTRAKGGLSGMPKTSLEFLRHSSLPSDAVKKLEKRGHKIRTILREKIEAHDKKEIKFADEELNGIIVPITGVPREIGGYTLATPMTNAFPLLDKGGSNNVSVLREYR